MDLRGLYNKCEEPTTTDFASIQFARVRPYNYYVVDLTDALVETLGYQKASDVEIL